MKFFHYTCSHAAPLIVRSGWVIPHRQIALPGKPMLIWLTDLEVPDRHGLGLTSASLKCDRTEHRAEVFAAPHEADRWVDYARERGWSSAVRATLEDLPGVLPMHWWVTAVPLALVEIRAVANGA